jgi:hypothetical protein
MQTGYLDGVSHYYIWNVKCKGDLPIVKYQHVTDLTAVIIINIRIDYIFIQYM